MMNKAEMNNSALEQVCGGTFTLNSLAEERYNGVGIKTCYHFFDKDEFWLPDGTKTNMDGADAYVKNKVGIDQFNAWYNEHHITSIYGYDCPQSI